MKKCTPLWREAHFEVKMYKTPQLRSTFRSWDVEKKHVVVARSTFRNQTVQNIPCSEHFWKGQPYQTEVLWFLHFIPFCSSLSAWSTFVSTQRRPNCTNTVWSASHGQTVSTPRNQWVAASAWLMLQCDLQIHVPGKPIVQSHQRNPSVGAMKPWWYLGTTLYVLPALLMQTTSTRGHGHSGGCDCMVWSPKQKIQPFYALKRYLSKSKIVFPAGALIWKLKLCLWPQPSRWFGKCTPLPLQISDAKHYLVTWPRSPPTWQGEGMVS